MDLPAFSNGAAYADLDNDGDMDYVVNNINDEAFLYRNNSREMSKGGHYLQVKLAGDSLNKNGLGAFIEFTIMENNRFMKTHLIVAIYLQYFLLAHFGLGATESVDSVIIKWPGGKMQLLQDVKADQLLLANIKSATV